MVEENRVTMATLRTERSGKSCCMENYIGFNKTVFYTSLSLKKIKMLDCKLENY